MCIEPKHQLFWNIESIIEANTEVGRRCSNLNLWFTFVDPDELCGWLSHWSWLKSWPPFLSLEGKVVAWGNSWSFFSYLERSDDQFPRVLKYFSLKQLELEESDLSKEVKEWHCWKRSMWVFFLLFLVVGINFFFLIIFGSYL